MDKIKRIFSLLIVIVIFICIIATSICALMGWNAAFNAFLWCTVVIPIFLYAVFLVLRVFSNKDK